MREKIIFFRSYYEAIEKLPKEQRLQVYEAVLAYALNDEETEESARDPVINAMLTLMKPNIDASNSISEARTEAGRRGGKANGSKPKANGSEEEKEEEIEKEIEKELEKESVKEKAPGDNSPEPRARFLKPTLEAVKQYCTERGNQVDPERFINYYTANGWKVGRNPMKDWRATVRTWERGAPGGIRGKPPKGTYKPQEEISLDDLF